MRLRRGFDEELRSHLVLFTTLAGGLVIGIAVNNLFLGEAIGLMTFLVVQLVRRLLTFRRPGLPSEPPAWNRTTSLYGRDSEVAQALKIVLADGVVAVAGPRDIGTSAVAEAVTARLIGEHGADPQKTFRFDLRSRSSRRPDDARATAGRILSPFRLAEPASGRDSVLANAGARLARLFADQYDVLMLDNVSVPAEVAWLVGQWPRGGGRPWLVIAGESAIESVVDDGTVVVGELDRLSMREMWEAELRAPKPRLRDRVLRRLRRIRRGEAGRDDLDELLEACLGRPRAVKALAREITRPGSTVTVDSLLAALRSTGPVEGPLERVWTAILDHLREDLPADAVWLLHALAELPVTALTTDAIGALLPGKRRVDAVVRPLEELRIRNLVQETEDGRYRMPTEIRRPIVRTRGREDRRAVARKAVPALLRHYVAETDEWAARLESGAAAGAADWFRDAELSLRPLFGKDNYRDEKLLAAVIGELARLATPLESWYLRTQQSGGLLEVNEGLHALAVRAERPDLARLAAIRMAAAYRMEGDPGRAGKMLGKARALAADSQDDRVRAELDMREHIERALRCLATGTGLKEAEAELVRVLASRHSDPDRATTAALINLGVLCLMQDRPADALNHLRRAEGLAAQMRDTGCAAHAVELQGVAMARQDGPLHPVVPLWQRAQELFDHSGEPHGQARCLQHLGAAALADPLVAGRLRDGQPTELSEQEAAEVALPLLKRSKLLRAGQPDTGLVDSYLELARKRLGLPPDEP